MSTDFREYSAAFHDHQNDLMHYGVKGMKWHKRKAGLKTLPGPQAPKDFATAYADSTEKKNHAKASKMYNKFSTLSSAQLRKIANSDAAYEDSSGKMPQGGYTTTSSIAEAVLNYRKKEPTNPHNAKKTGLQKAATEVARKEEKKRNRKLINARKAERAYRRGGH